MSTTMHATFGIRSDTVDPQDITEYLGLSPAHWLRRGDTYLTNDGREMIRPFNVWQLRSEGKVDSRKIEEHLQYILSITESLQDRLTKYLHDESIYIEIRIWWESESEAGGYTLSSELLSRLTCICKVINFTYILKRAEDA